MGNKIVTPKSLVAMLTTNSRQRQIKIIGRALVALFNRQTDDEKDVNDRSDGDRQEGQPSACQTRTGSAMWSVRQQADQRSRLNPQLRLTP